jgi:hypothetical protein
LGRGWYIFIIVLFTKIASVFYLAILKIFIVKP